LFSVSFPTDRDGFACGRSGTIIHTSDGGATWAAQKSGTKYSLSAIQFLDARNGWAVGEAGTIVATKDGGKTWVSQKSPVDIFLMDVQFINRQKGWAVGERTTILYTQDGGQSWKVQFKDEDFILKGVSFCDENNGWAAGEFGYIYRTSNGGASWKKQAGEFRFSPDTGEMEGGTFLFDVLALDPKTVWTIGIDGYLAVSTDGGNSWKKLQRDIPRTQLFRMASFGKGHLFIAGSGVLVMSTDGGKTFKEVRTEPTMTYGWLYSIAPRGNAGFVGVGKGGWVYVSDSKEGAWRRVGE
jgi:photosystem II stability/assembly factor-like uncharacterized protein